MRNLKELYELLLKEYLKYLADKNRFKSKGICAAIQRLEMSRLIRKKEFYLLSDDFQKRRPKLLSRFFWNKAFDKFSYLEPSGFWWENNLEGENQRVKFLRHIIKKL